MSIAFVTNTQLGLELDGVFMGFFVSSLDCNAQKNDIASEVVSSCVLSCCWP